MLMVRRIQEVFLQKMESTLDFNRPSSVGLVMHSDSIDGVPVHFILDESGGLSIILRPVL